MTLFEVIVHLVLWPFNAAVYTYGVLALMTGSEPRISVVAGAGVIALLLGLALALRPEVAAAVKSPTGRIHQSSHKSRSGYTGI
jgi:hypothetical protein